MQAKAFLTILPMLGLLLFSGCSSQEKQAPDPAPAAESNASLAGESAKENFSPQQPVELNLYTTYPADWIQEALSSFSPAVKVNIYNDMAINIVKKLDGTGSPSADVVLGLSCESLFAYADKLESYGPAGLDSIDKAFRDKENRFVGESVSPVVFFYNKEKLPDKKPPKSWMDLLGGGYKGKLALADPAKSGAAYTVLAAALSAMGRDDDSGVEYIKRLGLNLEKKALNTTEAARSGVLSGEYALAILPEREVLSALGNGYGVVYPSEGTIASYNGAAILSSSPNKEAAKALLDYFLTKEYQTAMSAHFVRPSRVDVKLPQNIQALKKIPFAGYSLSWATDTKEKNLQSWREAVNQGSKVSPLPYEAKQ